MNKAADNDKALVVEQRLDVPSGWSRMSAKAQGKTAVVHEDKQERIVRKGAAENNGWSNRLARTEQVHLQTNGFPLQQVHED
ncbi:predicted protein [Lichtheimia corymbifera JMRC:FSU:9682]|uniref:Uncharacterized protein n=1 Tax=Lichtheimia corymbifera JMRC:FSU:9682 TaxID=1263082 RepID=A0A068RQG7_9FUNG|nr:predicted protein [Lichtheimia corymbifera JMRC:FSU:9682]